jgi:hypothetical protein
VSGAVLRDSGGGERRDKCIVKMGGGKECVYVRGKKVTEDQRRRQRCRGFGVATRNRDEASERCGRWRG